MLLLRACNFLKKLLQNCITTKMHYKVTRYCTFHYFFYMEEWIGVVSYQCNLGESRYVCVFKGCGGDNTSGGPHWMGTQHSNATSICLQMRLHHFPYFLLLNLCNSFSNAVATPQIRHLISNFFTITIYNCNKYILSYNNPGLLQQLENNFQEIDWNSMVAAYMEDFA